MGLIRIKVSTFKDEKEEEKIFEEVGKEEEKNPGISNLKEYDPHNSVKEKYHARLLSDLMVPCQRDNEFKEEVIGIQKFVYLLIVRESPPHKVYDIGIERIDQYRCHSSQEGTSEDQERDDES